jgi:hypothetical protein
VVGFSVKVSKEEICFKPRLEVNSKVRRMMKQKADAKAKLVLRFRIDLVF